MVLHGGGIAFGVGEHLAGSVDDCGAGSGRQAFLSCDFGERMSTVGLDTVGEQKRFLSEVALNLGAQRGFPGTAQREIQSNGGNGDYNQERGQQFEEDPILHRLLIWGTRNGIRHRAQFSDSAGSPGPVRFSHGCGERRHPLSGE